MTVRTWPPYTWHDKTVIVTGGGGFLGRYVVDALHTRGLDDAQIVVPRQADYDLRHWDAIQDLFATTQSAIQNPQSKIVNGFRQPESRSRPSS